MINRKIGFSLLSIALAFAVMGGAAYAAFTSVASNNGNTFGAGNLVLSIDGAANATSTPKFTVANAFPGQVVDQPITLSNTGTVVSTTTVLSSVGHSSSSTPDLGNKLTLQIWDDVDGSGGINAGDVQKGSAHITDGAWSNIPLGFGLAASGGSHKVVARIIFDTDAGNTFQSSNSTFSLNFQTNQ